MSHMKRRYAPDEATYPEIERSQHFQQRVALIAALRDLLAEVDEMTSRVGWAGHGGRDKAREVLAMLGVR